MPLNIDITNIPITEITHGQCEVIDLGAGASNVPTNITVELPFRDGARVLVRWTGQPDIVVGDFVRIQRRADDTIWDLFGTSAGTASPAFPQTPLTGPSGWLYDNAGNLIAV